jgi:VanZ family protein
MGLIFVLSSRQKLPQPHGISPDLQAIAGHFTVYAVLAFLIFLALGDRGWGDGKRAIIAFVITVLYGVSDEFHQSFVPNRVPDVFDVAVDAAGALVGLLGGRVLTEARRRAGMTDQTSEGDQGQKVRQRGENVLRDR